MEANRLSDPDAMEAMVREHYAAVYRFCARRIGPEAAQDAAQDTFVSAQRSLKRFDGRSSLSTWLFGIAHNHCRNLARKNKREMLADDGWLCEEAMEPTTTTKEKQLVDRHTLREALAQLSPEHRDAVLLHEVEGLSYEEAGVVLGVPAGTVKSRLHYAFASLRRTLTEGMA